MGNLKIYDNLTTEDGINAQKIKNIHIISDLDPIDPKKYNMLNLRYAQNLMYPSNYFTRSNNIQTSRLRIDDGHNLISEPVDGYHGLTITSDLGFQSTTGSYTVEVVAKAHRLHWLKVILTKLPNTDIYGYCDLNNTTITNIVGAEGTYSSGPDVNGYTTVRIHKDNINLDSTSVVKLYLSTGSTASEWLGDGVSTEIEIKSVRVYKGTSSNEDAALALPIETTTSIVDGYVFNTEPVPILWTPFSASRSDSGVVTMFTPTTDGSVAFHALVSDGTNMTKYTVNAIYNKSTGTVSYTATSTTDIGDTSPVTLSVDINNGNVRLYATITGSSTWTIKGAYYRVEL